MPFGIPRAFYYNRIARGDRRARDGIGPTTTVTAGRGGLNAAQAKVMADAIAVLKQQGAIIVDPADVPSLAATDPKDNFAAWDFCSGADQAKGRDANCSVNFKYGMKRDFNLWLKSLGPTAPVKTLTALREWNLAHTRAGAIKYGQSRLDISDEMDLEGPRAQRRRSREGRRSAANGSTARSRPISSTRFHAGRRRRQLAARAAIRSSSCRLACAEHRPGLRRLDPKPRRSASVSPAPRAASRGSSSSHTPSSRRRSAACRLGRHLRPLTRDLLFDEHVQPGARCGEGRVQRGSTR